MARIEYDEQTDQVLMSIAIDQGLADSTPAKTRLAAFSYLLNDYKMRKADREKAEKLEQDTVTEYSRKELDELKELGASNIKGLAKAKVIRVIQDVMRANDKAKTEEDRIYITMAYIRKFLQQNLKSDTRYATIRNVVNEMQEEIDVHHTKHGLTKGHNMKIAQKKRRKS